MAKPLEELRNIAGHIPELEDWIEEWVAQVSENQLVMNSKYMSAEYSDFIKTTLVHNTAEELTELAANFTKNKRGYEMEMLVIRREK